MKKTKFLFFIIITISLLTGCSNTQNKIQKVFQTNSAAKVKSDYKEILKLLVSFKQKLNIRNPKNYNKTLSVSISKNINTFQNDIKLKVNSHSLETYNEYLQYAFDKNPNIKNRNDLLIVGLYKLIYGAYDINAGHQITALTYDIKKLQKLYYNLNSIKWRIKSYRDDQQNYLFLTWQKNWQIQLEKKIKTGETPSWKMIQNLEYIKQNRETIFESSNFSFEVLLSKMIYNVKGTLKNVGEEPIDVSIETMKSLILFL